MDDLGVPPFVEPPSAPPDPDFTNQQSRILGNEGEVLKIVMIPIKITKVDTLAIYSSRIHIEHNSWTKVGRQISRLGDVSTHGKDLPTNTSHQLRVFVFFTSLPAETHNFRIELGYNG